MSCNQQIREGDREGNYLRGCPVGGFYHVWKSLRLAGGNLLVSAGYGAFMVELDPAGRHDEPKLARLAISSQFGVTTRRAKILPAPVGRV